MGQKVNPVGFRLGVNRGGETGEWAKSKELQTKEAIYLWK